MIDPKVSAFLNSLPESHFQFFPIPIRILLTLPYHVQMINLPVLKAFLVFRLLNMVLNLKKIPDNQSNDGYGYQNAHDVIKQQLRRFEKTEHQYRPIDLPSFKQPWIICLSYYGSFTLHRRASSNTVQTKLNARRKQTFCELCGQRNELAEYFYKLDNNMLELEDEIESHNEQNPDNQKNYNSATGIVLTINRNTKWLYVELHKSALHSKDQLRMNCRDCNFTLSKSKSLKSFLEMN